MATDTNLNQLVINKLTQEQYNTAKNAGQIVETELYMITDSGGSIPTKTSELENDSGFITSAPVTSVNGKTGAVSLSASDVGAPTVAEMNAAIAAIPTPDVSGQINTHNSSDSAHQDIRTAVSNAASAAAAAQSTADGAVKKSGDYMTGNLSLSTGANPGTGIVVGNRYGAYLCSYYEDGAKQRQIVVCNASDHPDKNYALRFVDTETNSNEIVLHTGNMAALGCTQITTGSYTGTGKSGSSNQNSLTFSFEPKLLMVSGDGNYSVYPYGGNGGWINGFIWQYGTSKVKDTNGTIDITVSGNTIKWYCGTSLAAQYNTSGKTYYYLAIG